MTNHVRTLILGLPPSPDPVRWGRWIDPGFLPGSPSPAEARARSCLLGFPMDRQNAEFVATMLCRLAMDFPPSLSSLASTFGTLSFSFDLGHGTSSISRPSFHYDPVVAATEAAPHLARAAAASPAAFSLSTSEWFRPSAGLAFAATCSAILAMSALARSKTESEA